MKTHTVRKPPYSTFLDGKTYVVCVLGSREDLAMAEQGIPGIDLYEPRIDLLMKVAALKDRLRKLGKPLIITMRDASESGNPDAKQIPSDERAFYYRKYLSIATFIDMEASTVKDKHLLPIIREARALHVGTIISAHWFLRPPKLAELERASLICREVGGDVLKSASSIRTNEQWVKHVRYTDHIRRRCGVPYAPMAMDDFALISRFVAAKMGSPFFYSKAGLHGVVGNMLHASQVRSLLTTLIS